MENMLYSQDSRNKFWFLKNYLPLGQELGLDDLFSSWSFFCESISSLSESAYCRFSLIHVSIYYLVNFPFQVILILFTVSLYLEIHVSSVHSLKRVFNHDFAYDICYCTQSLSKVYRNWLLLFYRYLKQIVLLLWIPTQCITPSNHFTFL